MLLIVLDILWRVGLRRRREMQASSVLYMTMQCGLSGSGVSDRVACLNCFHLASVIALCQENAIKGLSHYHPD